MLPRLWIHATWAEQQRGEEKKSRADEGKSNKTRSENQLVGGRRWQGAQVVVETHRCGLGPTAVQSAADSSILLFKKNPDFETLPTHLNPSWEVV